MNPAAGTEPLHRVERIARLLDEAVTVPGTRIKVGLDAVIGLIPGVGDVAGIALGGWFIYEAHRLGAPNHLKLKMARNVAVDALAGLVPVLGDLVDIGYRSNRRNVQLLREHFAPTGQAPRRPASVVRIAVVVGALLALTWVLFTVWPR